MYKRIPSIEVVRRASRSMDKTDTRRDWRRVIQTTSSMERNKRTKLRLSTGQRVSSYRPRLTCSLARRYSTLWLHPLCSSVLCCRLQTVLFSKAWWPCPANVMVYSWRSGSFSRLVGVSLLNVRIYSGRIDWLRFARVGSVVALRKDAPREFPPRPIRRLPGPSLLQRLWYCYRQFMQRRVHPVECE